MTVPPTTRTGAALAWLARRRSAILSAAATLAAVLAPPIVAGDDVTAPKALSALACAVIAYGVAYYALGARGKATVAAVAAGLSSVGSGLETGLTWQAITVTTVIVVLSTLGVVPALPSTAGSAAPRRRRL